MLLIRRMDDGKRSYTAIFLPGEPARIFPTSNQEHARILQIYKQDRPYPDVLNDFTEYEIGQDDPKHQPTRTSAIPRKPNASSSAKPGRSPNRKAPGGKKSVAGKPSNGFVT